MASTHRFVFPILFFFLFFILFIFLFIHFTLITFTFALALNIIFLSLLPLRSFYHCSARTQHTLTFVSLFAACHGSIHIRILSLVRGQLLAHSRSRTHTHTVCRSCTYVPCIHIGNASRMFSTYVLCASASRFLLSY